MLGSSGEIMYEVTLRPYFIATHVTLSFGKLGNLVAAAQAGNIPDWMRLFGPIFSAQHDSARVHLVFHDAD